MGKKVLSLVMAVVMLMSFGTVALAFETDDVVVLTKAQQPRWTYIISCTTGLSIDGNYATMGGMIECTNDITSNKITLSLQKYQNGAWTTIFTDSKTTSGPDGSFETGTSVSSGTYRTLASYQAKIGSRTVESTSNSSPQKTC